MLRIAEKTIFLTVLRQSNIEVKNTWYACEAGWNLYILYVRYIVTNCNKERSKRGYRKVKIT